MEEYGSPLEYSYKGVDAAGNEIDYVGELVTHLTKDVKSVTTDIPDRFDVIGEWMLERNVISALESEGGLFRNHPLVDASNKMHADAHNIAVARSFPKLLGSMFDKGIMTPQVAGKGIQVEGATLEQLFKSEYYAHLDPDVILENLASMNPKVGKLVDANPDDWKKILLSSVIPPSIRDDLLEAGSFSNLPKSLQSLEKLMRSATALFKAGVLTHPARYERDLVSGQIANYMNDMWSWDSAVQAKKVLFGQAAENLVDSQEIMNYAMRTGMIKNASEFNAEVASSAARSWYGSLKGEFANQYRDPNTEEVGSLFSEVSQAGDLRESLPGTHSSLRAMGKDVLDYMLLRKGSKNPIDVEGVQYFTGPKSKAGMIRRRHHEGFQQFGWAEAGGIISKNADDMNRLVGWLEGMRRGKSGKEAFADMTRVQLNYNPHTFGPLEQRALKKIFPFYSFFSRETAYLTNELMTNPAGKLGKLIRLQRHADESSKDEYLPDHVRAQLAIPIGDSADGGRNYLTGLGLMHEDPISTIMGAVANTQSGVRSVLAKSNPIVKGFAEYGLGRSSFQGGPMGGRDLEDMDPVIGRILTQLGLQDELPGGQAAPFMGSRGLEFVASNSPISRALSSLKMALDSRKTKIERAANLTTGMRITTVSPQGARSGLRDTVNAIIRDAGGRGFQSFSASDELLDYLKENNPEAYEKVVAGNELKKLWLKNDRAIKRQAKAAP